MNTNFTLHLTSLFTHIIVDDVVYGRYIGPLRDDQIRIIAKVHNIQIIKGIRRTEYKGKRYSSSAFYISKGGSLPIELKLFIDGGGALPYNAVFYRFKEKPEKLPYFTIPKTE